MKKITPILFLLLLMIGCPAKVCASDGDVFTATTTEGVEMTFMVISESKKTCQVGDDIHSAIEKDIEKVTIPEKVNGYKVTKVGEEAFVDCWSLTSISIPSSITELGYGAFSECGITSITIPSSIKTISESAFWGCTELVTINISQGVSSIEDYAFEYCSSLTSLTIPSSVNSISNGCFYGCTSLASIIVNSDNKFFDSRNNCNAIIETKSNTLIVGCKGTIIPSSVTRIGDLAFCGCKSLTGIDIPESIISIGYRAFRDCGLRTIKIPASIKSLGEGVFSRCASLASIIVEENNAVYDSRDNCNAIIESESGVLVAGCQNTEIPLGVTSIAASAFEGSASSSVTIPSGVTSIGNSAFSRCSGLTSITIPNSVTSIGEYAFYDCSSLISIRSAIKNPFPCGWLAFSGIPSSTILYVPKGTKDFYTGKGWPTNIKELMPDKPEISVEENGITMKSSATATAVYYTTDGSTPTITSIRYEGPFWPTERYAIKAMATIDDMFDSEITEYRPACSTPVASFNGSAVTLKTSTGGATIHYTTDGTNPTIESTVFANEIILDSLCTIKAIAVRELLDNSPLLTYTLPYFYNGNTMFLSQNGTLEDAVNSCGISMDELSSVVWVDEAIPAGRFAGVTNPNLLLYVKQLPYAANAKADGVKNVIANGHAESITLTDATEGTGNFYCPEEFTADQITYTHEYQMETGINECRGWETLTLPFDVETVTHETKGELTPMAINDPDKAPFWLDELTESGFTPASTIKAYKPYIISMPNNDAYGNEYKLNGRVTFSARNAFVGVTEPQKAIKGNVTLTPCFNRQAESAQIYVINAGTTYHGLPEGSTFVPNLRAARPFEAYVTSDSNNARYFSISDFGNTDTSVLPIQQTMPSFDALYDLGGRKWNGGLWIIKKGCKILKQK